MKKKYLLFLIAVIVGLLALKRWKYDSLEGEHTNSERIYSAFPVKVMPSRDGQTTMIKISNSQNNKSKQFFLVHINNGGELSGKIYTEADWESSIPLSQGDAENALNEIVKSLESYYGKKELKKIENEKNNVDNMTDEKISNYIKDPTLNHRLDAGYALDLVEEFRKYIKPPD